MRDHPITNVTGPEQAAPAVAPRLLAWYDVHARALPWRVGPAERAQGVAPDPYRVWLSEVMLQQTTVATVRPRFDRFLERWPTVADLAGAPREAVLAEWAGLGYYARARNLHACAAEVAERHGGRFPDTEEGLRALPGIGAYTAAAIAAIAFDRPATVVDGNVERVAARLFAETMPMPKAKPRLAALAARLTPAARPGCFAQSMMDLGATVCVPRRPACTICPLVDLCRGRAEGIAESLPAKAPKRAKPTRQGIAYAAFDAEGRVGTVLRPDKGLLAGMRALPTTDWAEDTPAPAPPVRAAWREAGSVTHVFTHFRLELVVMTVRLPTVTAPVAPAEARASMPTVFRKALDRALGH
ncbi:MAG: A/G-specific adenine glycosylase [Pseudomonadota bacterium]